MKLRLSKTYKIITLIAGGLLIFNFAPASSGSKGRVESDKLKKYAFEKPNLIYTKILPEIL